MRLLKQALALGACGQQHGGGRGCLAEADGLHVGLDVAHRVVDGRQRRERAAGAVQVDADRTFRIHRLDDCRDTQ